MNIKIEKDERKRSFISSSQKFIKTKKKKNLPGFPAIKMALPAIFPSFTIFTYFFNKMNI